MDSLLFFHGSSARCSVTVKVSVRVRFESIVVSSEEGCSRLRWLGALDSVEHAGERIHGSRAMRGGI